MTTRTALTTTAKTFLRTAIKDGNRYIIDMSQRGHIAAIQELRGHGLVEVTRSIRFPRGKSWKLTASGELMREKVEHRNRVHLLAAMIRQQKVTGEDLADIAASIDAEELEYVGNERVWLNMSLVASLAPAASGRPLGCSAEDIRQEVETVLGWND